MISVAALVTGMAAPAEAAVRCVPASAPGCDAAHPTVAAAVTAAVDGDTIRLAPGSYAAPLTPVTKRLAFEGDGAGTLDAFDPGAQTRLVGPANGPGLYMTSGGSLRDLRVVGGAASAGMDGRDGLTLGGSYELTRVVALGSAGNGAGQSGGSGLQALAGGGAHTTTVTDAAFRGGAPEGRAVYFVQDPDDRATISRTLISGMAGEVAALLYGGTIVARELSVTGEYGVLAGFGLDLRIERSRIETTGYGISNSGAGASVAVANSLVVADGAGARAVAASTSNAAPATVRLNGSTAIARGSGELSAVAAFQGGGTGAVGIDLRNSVARVEGGGAGSADLRAEDASITADFSAFSTVSGTAPAAGSASNVVGDPLLTPAFAPSPGSPLVDRGDPTDVVPGALDLAGTPRPLDGNRDCTPAPDIGAFELTGNAAPCPGGGPPPGPVPNAAPTIDQFSMTNRVFAPVVRSGGSAARANRRMFPARVKRGTRFRYTLSEAAAVAIAIERAGPGRRAGGRCAKPSRKNRRGKRCTRWVRTGTLRTQAQAGPQSLTFSGRFGRRALRPGRYRARIAAVDAAGARSAERRLGFRVVRPKRSARASSAAP